MDNLELGLLIRGHLLIRPLQALRLVARWGVRETMRVELTSGGVAFPAWGMGERCKLPHRGLGRSTSSFATFTMLKSQNIA